MSEAERQGQLDALAGKPCYYGPHFGMRSTYEQAKADYAKGWAEVNHYLTKGDTHGRQ